MGAEITLNIKDSTKPEVKIVDFQGELDESNLESSKQILEPLLKDNAIKGIVLNFHSLEFINSKGIGFLVSVHTHLTKDGRKLAIVDASEPVMDVISLVGLTSIIGYYNTVDEAVAAL